MSPPDPIHGFFSFQFEVRQARRFVRSPESEEFLRIIASRCKTRIRDISVGTVYWRAQLGATWVWDEKHAEEWLEPFEPERMKPLPNRALEGRINANVAIFDLEAVEQIACQVYEVESIDFEFAKTSPEWAVEGGKRKAMSIKTT